MKIADDGRVTFLRKGTSESEKNTVNQLLDKISERDLIDKQIAESDDSMEESDLAFLLGQYYSLTKTIDKLRKESQ